MADPVTPHVQELLDGLAAAREEFLAAVADIDPALRTTPGLVGDWSARDLLAHVGYWAGHAAESLHRAEQGELHEFGKDELSVDDRNEVVTRVARETDYATVASREQGAYEAFVARLTAVDPESLDDRDADGDTLNEIIAFDGADHYREHTLDIRAWFDGKDAPDEADPDEADAD
ncbi:MAG: maleylpyruvate isomerase N-terminal domain-containing protein [Candidatus Limnocylindria bacterium]